MDKDAQKYREYLCGNDEAFKELMESLFKKLVLFINGYIHDIYAAEDIAIDVFTELIVHKHRFNFKVKLKTYLFMLGRSRALDYLKHNKVISVIELDDTHYLADVKSLEKATLDKETYYELYLAISKLNTDMQSVIFLYYLENLSYDEISKITRKSKKDVDNLLYRSKKILKESLPKEVYEFL